MPPKAPPKGKTPEPEPDENVITIDVNFHGMKTYFH